MALDRDGLIQLLTCFIYSECRLRAAEHRGHEEGSLVESAAGHWVNIKHQATKTLCSLWKITVGVNLITSRFGVKVVG